MRPFLAAIACALPVCGCVATPLGTARTLAPGDTQHQLGVGVVPLIPSEPDVCRESHDVSCGGIDVHLIPAGFTWTFRRGLGDGVEGGVGAHLLGLHGDLKLALARGRWFALAADPGMAAGPVVSAGVPLLLDLDLGPAVSLVLAAGPHLTSPSFARGTLARLEVPAGAWITAGAGLWFRPSERFALQPGFLAFIPFDDQAEYSGAPVVAAGLGVLVGAAARPGR